jgi:hypothetical protein
VLDPNEPGAAFRGYSGPIKARNRSWIFSG